MAARIVSLNCLRILSKQSNFILPNVIHYKSMSIKNVNGMFVIPKTSVSRKFSTDLNESEEGAAENVITVDPIKDRSKIIPVEVSMNYLNSNAYQITYGTETVWTKYRRNFKGMWAPETRKTCIRQGKISTGNPCPICRDEYLVLDYRNVKLLNQFISPFNGQILPTKKTGLCQHKHKDLVAAIYKARDYGLISFDVPHRNYDYPDYSKEN